MAPEQMEGRELDAWADLLSLGALFYELLSYRRACPGDMSDGILRKILFGRSGERLAVSVSITFPAGYPATRAVTSLAV